MPLQTVQESNGSLGAPDIYASDLAARTLPKYRMPEVGVAADVAYSLVRDELMLDGNSRQNLATFRTTWIEPQVRQLRGDSVDKNMIDKDEYPQTAEIESRCVHILARLWNSSEAATTIGCSTTGSSESAMPGGLAMKWRWRKAGKPRLVSWLVGLYVFKMDPILLAGAVAGSRSSTTAMKAMQDAAKSPAPAFGYPVPYALSAVIVLIFAYLAMVFY